MVSYRDVIKAFFEYREARGRHDRAWLRPEDTINYSYRGVEIACMYGKWFKLYCYHCYYGITKGLFMRYAEIARALKERYGVDIEFELHMDRRFPYILCRIGSVSFILFGSVTLNLEEKALVYVDDSIRVYPINEKVEPIADIRVGKDFVLTIGAVRNDIVARFTKYDAEYLEKLQIRFYRPFPAYWLAEYWISLTDHSYNVRVIVNHMDKNACNKLDTILKQYKLL